MDKVIDKLADNILDYSLKVTPNTSCLIWTCADAFPLVSILSDKCRDKDITTFVHIDEEMAVNAFLKSMNSTDEASNKINQVIERYLSMLDDVESVVIIRGKKFENPFEGVEADMIGLWQRGFGRVFEKCVNNKRWLVMDWPTQLQADKANMTYEAFYNYVMEVSAIDYQKLKDGAMPLKELMDQTDRVKIINDQSSLTFSIKDIPTIIGAGEISYIDGEIYTAPVKESVEGFVKFNVLTNYLGQTFKGIELTFEQGKISKATCEVGDEKRLNEILDLDEGSRYLGEFAIGLNPSVTLPMNDIHYDEKIFGSIHLTPGQCYDAAPNGNASGIHWDMVLLLTQEAGGGEIWFDDQLVQKDGLFVLDELSYLNPDV